MADASEPAGAEAERLLTGLARGRFGAIQPQRIARHVLAHTPEAEWAVYKAAFDALARRFGFARRDQLRVAQAPRGGVFGSYSTESAAASGKRSGARPYRTALYGLEPLRASCSCTDFVRSSLGLCKHALVVLEALDKERAGTGDAPAREPQLTWDARQPVRGNPDRLLRLSAAPSSAALAKPKERLAFIETLLEERSDAEPAVRTLLLEEQARVQRALVLAPRTAACLKALKSLQRKLYPYQREGVKRFFERGRLLLADDMGLGKTTQAIAACHGLFASRGIERGLLVMPAALKAQWVREWQATSNAPLWSVDGSPKERAKLYEGTRRGFLAIGYEQLLRDFAQVQRFSPQLVVLDEAQRIKNWASKSAAFVKLLDPEYRLVLTGTPMENRFDELASIMDFVDDLALEPKWRLVPFHTLVAANGKLGGARNLDVLRERLSHSMLRRVRREVLEQLPPRTDTRVPVELSELQRERHDELRQPIAELAARAERRPLAPAEFMQLMQLLTSQRIICNGIAQQEFEREWPRLQHEPVSPELLARLSAPKLSALRTLIEQIVLDQGRKAVVFSQWRNMLQLSEWAVRDLLQGAGMQARFFTGAESQRVRQQALLEFEQDPNTSVLFLSDAGGVGLNLQHAASCCINLELPWNPAVLEQRIGRIYRLGQERPIDVYNLVSEGGIEGRIAQLIAHKQAVFGALFDGTSDEVQFDGPQGSFVEGVKQLVDALPVAPAADSGEDLPTPEPAPEPSPEPAAPRRELRVERLPDGWLRIEAPPELAELLEALARKLQR